jgi:hypothetical protein
MNKFQQDLKNNILVIIIPEQVIVSEINLLNIDTPFFKYLLTVILHMELGSCFRIFKPVIQFLA